MTGDALELHYDLLARDKAKARSWLDGQALRRNNRSLSLFSNRYAQPIAVVFLGVMVIRWLVDFVPSLFTRDLAELLRPGEILGILMGLLFIWIIVENLRTSASDVLRWLRASKHWREGIHWGPHILTATSEALTVRLAGRKSIYRWAAFTGLEKTKDMLFLMLTPRAAVAVPRRAFDSAADERAFQDFVETRIGMAP